MGRDKRPSLLIPDPHLRLKSIDRGGSIPQAAIGDPDKDTIQFFFKYLEHNHKRFNCSEPPKNFWSKLVLRMKNMEGMTIRQLKEAGDSARFHEIKWEDTSQRRGYSHLPLPEQLKGSPPFQFGISQERGRVHGILAGRNFYVIWIDYLHQLYPGK